MSVETKDDEVCTAHLSMVRRNGCTLKNVPHSEQTEEMCEIAVANYGLALEWCKFQTQKIVDLAVRENPYAVKYAREEFLNDEFKLALLAKNPKLINSFKHPTEEMYIFCLKQTGLLLRYMKFQTLKMCLVACATDGRALQFVHPSYQIDEVVRVAIAQNPLVEQYLSPDRNTNSANVPDRVSITKTLPVRMLDEKYKSSTSIKESKTESKESSELDASSIKEASKEELVQQLANMRKAEAEQNKLTGSALLDKLANDGMYLKNVPHTEQELEHCRTAVSNNGYAIQYVRPDLLSDELYMLSVSKDPQCIILVPFTEDLYLKMLDLNVQIFKYMDPKHHTMKLCSYAVSKDGLLIQYANPIYLEEEDLWKTACSNNGEAIQFNINPSVKIARLAVKQNRNALSLIRKEELRDLIEEELHK